MGEVSTARVVTGEPKAVQDLEVGSPLSDEHKKAVEAAKNSCPRGVNVCRIMPFVSSHLELKTQALGAFCINGCPTLQRFSD